MVYFGPRDAAPDPAADLLVGAAGGVYPPSTCPLPAAQVLKANKSTAEAAGSGALRSGW
jgi:hypothetical protein